MESRFNSYRRSLQNRFLWRLPAFSMLLFGADAAAQQATSLTGTVTDPDNAAIAGAAVLLENPLTLFRAEQRTDRNGQFAFLNVPLQDYQLAISQEGFRPFAESVSLRAPIPLNRNFTLEIAAQGQTVEVTAYEATELLDVEATGTRTALSLDSTQRLPIPVSTRGLETVLLSFPGFAQNANGAIHPRGAHNQMTYVIDGMPISDQLTGSFASALDPKIAQSLELFTGNIPAEFGNKVSAVANVITRSGLGSGRQFFGQSEVDAAHFDTLSHSTQVGGQHGRLGWFSTVTAFKTNRFLDPVSLDNLHNGGNAVRAFTRLDWQATPGDLINFHAMAGRSSFEVANLRSQQAAGQRQRQLLRDAAIWANWVHTLDVTSILEVTAAYRTNLAQLFSSPGDTPVTADQARHLSTLTLNTRYTRIEGAHRLRAGLDWNHIPLSEDFSFGITDPSFNVPGTAGFRPTLLPHDLSRGGDRFYFSAKDAGNLYSAFVQDDVRAGAFTFGLGMRFDSYRFLASGHQWQPRLGVAYYLKQTGTVFRASYNRNYQTPPNENLLLSNSTEAAALAPASVQEALGSARAVIRPERQDVFELGLQQSLFGRVGLNASYYHKRSSDQQDNDNFLNTGIIFPLTLQGIRVNGVEGRLVFPEFHGLQGTFSATHARAISTPPFTGGLFLNSGAVDALTSGPFVIDHDQKLSMQTNAVYAPARRVSFSTSIRYDSGLVTNPSDPAQVAADPDFADLLPFVKLNQAVPRTRPRTIADLAVSYTHFTLDRPLWDLQLQANNVTNETALYNFQSLFVGTRVVPPRILGVRFRYYW